MTDRFKIGGVEADFVYMRIVGDEGPIAVEPKIMSVLRVLVDRADEVVSRDEIIDSVWGSSFGGEERLSRAISLLRKALGDVQGRHEHIETVPRTGYRLIASVSELPTPQSSTNKTLNSNNQGKDNGLAVGAEPASLPTSHLQDSPPPLLDRTKLSYLLGFVLAGALLIYFWPFNSATNIASSNAGHLAKETPDPGNTSIAVLPFADLSPSGDQQYFATGLAEEILNSLARVRGLRIAGRTSSFAYREKPADAKAIGDALQVSYLLEGSVRKQDDRVRVSAQLVRTSDGQQMWSERYDGNLSDIFELQETVAQSIASALAPNSLTAATGRLARELTKDRDAYELYLQGREMSRRFGREEKLTAIGLLEQAVSLDPGFADAWAWLARSYLFVPITDPLSEQGVYIAAARDATRKALSNEPELAMAHYVMALLNDYDLKFDASFEAMERAYAAAPNQPFFAIRRGRYHIIIGHVEEGARMIEEGLRMDPTDAPGLLHLASAKIHLGRIEEGLTLMRRSESLGFLPATLTKCIYLGRMGREAATNNCWSKQPQTIRDRFPEPLGSDQYWDTLGRAFLFGEEDAREQMRPIVTAVLADEATSMNPYQLGTLEPLGEYKLFMELFVDRRFAINASLIYNLWLWPNRASPIVRHPDFLAFAERIGLLRAWQNHGWPDICSSPSASAEDIQYLECGKG